MMIQLKKVVPVYLEKEKIDRSEVWNQEVSFAQGERVQIVAPSGSGKSSFVHFLYGLRKDYEGKILFDQQPISQYNSNEIAAYRSNKVSVIFQDLRLFTEHTVQENIEVKRINAPFHAAGRIREMAAALGIAGKLNNLIKTCSYGEQQRVAIIRALQQPFDFLLMDEPFSHLDENNRSIAMQLIDEEVKKRKASVILADLKIISQFSSDRTLQL